ncbi:MAG: CDP-alcohol phosphatidyltransferase family protein [Candidatus Paceibacterota bacterium]
MQSVDEQKPKKSFNILYALPDFFTVLRIPIGIAIAFVGIFFGRNGVTIAYWLLLGGWTTDILDGNIARKIGKKKTWIGEHDILFDSIMLLGVIFYLGYVGFMSVLLTVVSFVLLLFVNVYPNTRHQTKFFVESLITCTTLPFLFYLSLNPLIIAVTIAWATLNLLYDIDRAMVLGKKWQDILVNVGKTLKSYSLKTNLTWSILVIGIGIGTAILLFNNKIPFLFGGIIKGLAVVMILIALWALWLGRRNLPKKPEE